MKCGVMDEAGKRGGDLRVKGLVYHDGKVLEFILRDNKDQQSSDTINLVLREQ